MGSNYLLLHKYSCLIGTSSSKGYNSILGGKLGQGPAAEVTYLELKQPPVYPVICISIVFPVYIVYLYRADLTAEAL